MPVQAPAYPDAIAAVATYLRSALVSAGQPTTVVGKIPNPRPAKFVQVLRTGGPEVVPLVMDGAQITIDCWAPSSEAVWDLTALVRRLVKNMRGTVQGGASIHSVSEFGGPQDLPDPVSNTPRVSFTVQVQIRGQAA